MVQQLTSDTLPPSAIAAVQLCDRDPTKEAVFSYRWEWGETGFCCAEQAVLLQQTAESLKRTIALYPIQKSGPEPLLRDERTKLVAKHLVLEAELEEAKSAGLETYRRNGDLQVQLNSAIIKERELKAQLSDQRAQFDEVTRRNEALNSENGSLLVELERLRHLETFVQERSEREAHERGLDGGELPTTVDG